MTNFDIKYTFDNLMQFRQENSAILPAKIAFAIVRNLHKLQPIVEDYEQARLGVIIANGGKQSPERPDIYTLETKDESILSHVNSELKSLGETENNDIKLIKIKFSDLDGLNLSISQMDALYSIIEEEES